jgi:diguanylate cyclase (GGDEF)-like protein
MADVDYFTSLNAIYGHHLGDRILSEIAKIFKIHTRKIDLAVRYGGDEIALLLSNTNKEGASILANRLCQAVREHQLMVGKTRVPLTVSIGVVTYPEAGTTKEELISTVEKGIHKARELGRNQVYVYSAEGAAEDKVGTSQRKVRDEGHAR